AFASKYLTTDATYKTTTEQEFNCLTPEHSMKWGAVESVRDHPVYSAPDKLIKFARANQMKVRGHALVWHDLVPKWVQEMEHNVTELEEVMKKHIVDEMTHFKGKIYAWDVVNEVLEGDGTWRNTIWHRAFGSSFVAEAFKTARTADYSAKLYINEHSVEGKNNKSDALYSLCKELLAQGVPVQGVGMQAHLILGQVPKDMVENMQRFADLGLDVAITELDIRIKLPTSKELEAQQARDYAQVYSNCLSVKRCVGVTVWGFTDKYSWMVDAYKDYGDAFLWDKNYKPKPSVTAIENVLK
ncbi:unnamed protein product, partial [Oppiella nova]